MTRIEYGINEDEFSILCRGHAGYAELGSDIVCAGISTLIQTLSTHLSKVTKNYKTHIEPGSVWIWSKGYESRICFEEIMTGLNLLESNYPQYICIEKGCPIISENPLQ